MFKGLKVNKRDQKADEKDNLKVNKIEFSDLSNFEKK